MKKAGQIAKEDWEEVDSPPLTDDELSRMRPVKEHHPNIPRRVRGIQHTPTKIPVSIRLSPQVVEYFKDQGKGWQTKVDEALREYIETH